MVGAKRRKWTATRSPKGRIVGARHHRTWGDQTLYVTNEKRAMQHRTSSRCSRRRMKGANYTMGN